MFFRVENLGPLREAEVDLGKRMILLTGPNSTGKTYLAWSVYGLFRSPPDGFRALANEILHSPHQHVSLERLIDIWPDLLEGCGKQLASQLHLCFASERRFFEHVKIAIRPDQKEPSILEPRTALFHPGGPFIARLFAGPQLGFQVFKLSNPQIPPWEQELSETVGFQELDSDIKNAFESDLLEFLTGIVRSSIWPQATLLPTERTAIDLFAPELSMRRNRLMHNAAEAQLDLGFGTSELTASLVRDVGRYPWPIQDNLILVNDLAYLARRESEFADLATELETLLGGVVALSQQGAISFKPAGSSPAIGIHLTSSVVKSLARLVFYFRHLARENQVLIIDEPELNLHPDNQRKIARVLAKATNRGLSLIMSTHSDYFLREINNLIALSRDSDALRKVRDHYGYTQDELLSADMIGVYLFKDSTAEAIPVDESGFEVSTIEDEINRLNEISQDIYAAIHE